MLQQIFRFLFYLLNFKQPGQLLDVSDVTQRILQDSYLESREVPSPDESLTA